MKYLHNSDPWYLAEDIPDMDLFFAQIWLSCFVNEFKNPGGLVEINANHNSVKIIKK